MRKVSILPLFGIVLFAAIIVNIDVSNVILTLASADMTLVSYSLILTVPNVVLKALKWKLVIKSYGKDYGLFRAVRAWMAGFFLGIITPGRVGDLSRALYLRKEAGVSGGRALSTVFVDRVTDIVVLFCFSLVGISVLAGVFTEGTGLIAYISAVFMTFLLVVIAFTRKGLVSRILRPLSSRLIPRERHSIMSRAFHDFYDGFSGMKKLMIIAAVGLCSVTWIISITQFWLLASAIGLRLPYTFFIGVVPIAVLLDTLPISFSGIGTRDAALIFFFSLVSLPSEPAVSLSLLSFITTYVTMGIVGAAFWAANPIRRSHLTSAGGSGPLV